jgi:hypothetical protein
LLHGTHDRRLGRMRGDFLNESATFLGAGCDGRQAGTFQRR